MMAPALLPLLLACPKAPPDPASIDWNELPRLPSPTAGTYAAAPGRPTDPGVAAVFGARPWDAALAGAAAGLALPLSARTGQLTVPEIREAAWRAGWPYPIAIAQVWTVRVGEPPPAAITQWVTERPAPQSVALVRARGGLDDVWVGLGSTVRVDLGVLPRQLPVGGALQLPIVPGATATVADPAGELHEGALDAGLSLPVDLAGEWLVDVRDQSGPLAIFPVYVGIVPPDLTLLVPSARPVDVPQAEALVDRLLAEVRDAYGLAPFQPDVLLASAARASAADPSYGLDRIVQFVGVPREDLWRWECRSSTVEGCLDAIVWDVRARPGLLAEQGLLGRVVEVGPDGVRVVLVVARESLAARP